MRSAGRKSSAVVIFMFILAPHGCECQPRALGQREVIGYRFRLEPPVRVEDGIERDALRRVRPQQIVARHRSESR